MLFRKSFGGMVRRPRSVVFRPRVELLESRNLPSFIAAPGYAVDSGPESVAAADFNGDGAADVAVVNASSGLVSILLNKGNGSLQAAHNYAVGFSPESIAVGDFNGDHVPDLAVANSLDGTI